MFELLRWVCRYRSIRLTPDGTRLLLLTLAIGIAAINTGNNLLYLLLAMLLSLIVMSGILSERCLKHLVIRRCLPEHIFANQPVAAAFSIANRKKRVPTFSLRVLDVVEGAAIERGVHLLHLPPQATIRRTYPLLIERRGRHKIEAVKLLTRFPFGLFLKAATLPLESEVIVYPEIKPLPDQLLKDLTALGQEQAVPRRGPGVALHNLRDYQSGDDSRLIHWKTSARQEKLMVRETEREDQRRVALALPTVPPSAPALPAAQMQREQAFEKAVTLVASLAAFFYERAYAIRLLVGEQELPYGSGPSHFYQALRLLALCPFHTESMNAGLEQLRMLGREAAAGALTILVLPWEAPYLHAMRLEVSRTIRIWELP